jgi:hypothetical protein
MSDLRTLHDAFAELDRRADAAAAGTAADMAPVVRPRRAVRLVPVAATVVAVAALVASAVWLVPGDPGPHTASQPSTSSSTAQSPVPISPDDLIARFSVVLGDTATFEVTTKWSVPKPSPSIQPLETVTKVEGPGMGAMVSGTLTSAGFTGSWLLTMHPSESEPGEWCDRSRPMVCDVSTLPDGSRLATGTLQPDVGAVAYMACVKRPDGTMILMKVSNQEDPSGTVTFAPGGRIYSPQSPLTLEQMKAIVTSDKW